MKRNLIETILGAIVLFVAIFFVITTYQSSGVKKDYGTKLFANFDKVDGITTGSDVRLGGIKIGSVTGLELDAKTYRAKLDFGIQDKIGIPTDSSAVIASDGLLGGKYVNIVPGGDNEMLKSGGQIEYTQSSVNLEELIGKFAFGSAGSNSAGGDKPAQKPADEKTSLNSTPVITPAPAAVVTPPKKSAPPVSETPAPKKADVVEVAKPTPAPDTDASTADSPPPAELPKSDTPPPAAPAGPPVTITPKIVKVPQPGDTQ